MLFSVWARLSLLSLFPCKLRSAAAPPSTFLSLATAWELSSASPTAWKIWFQDFCSPGDSGALESGCFHWMNAWFHSGALESGCFHWRADAFRKCEFRFSKNIHSPVKLSRHCSRSVFPFVPYGLNYIKRSTELTNMSWEISFAVLLGPQICAIKIPGRRPWYTIILCLFMTIMLWHVLCPGFVENALMVCQRVKDHDLNIIYCGNCMFSRVFDDSLFWPLIFFLWLSF